MLNFQEGKQCFSDLLIFKAHSELFCIMRKNNIKHQSKMDIEEEDGKKVEMELEEAN